MTKKNEYWGLE